MDSVVDFEMDNKTPGKDITTEDLETKFPLAAKKHDNHKTVVKIDDIEIGGNELIIFAGPNTVENREMILETAEQVKKRRNRSLTKAEKNLYKKLQVLN